MSGCIRGAGNGAEEALAGMMSPPSGYSSGDEPVPYATAEQAASIQARPLPATLSQAARSHWCSKPLC